MKTLLPLLLLGLLAVPAKAAEPDDQLPPAPEGKIWKLVWHDEFDGDKLDESKWTYRPDGKRKGGWWSSKAISLDGEGQSDDEGWLTKPVGLATIETTRWPFFPSMH